jgi:hypothetical protein
LSCPVAEKQKIFEDVRKQIRQFCRQLKDYKQSPEAETKIRIRHNFDSIFTRHTRFRLLNLALKRLQANKDELPLVSDRPEIPPIHLGCPLLPRRNFFES